MKPKDGKGREPEGERISEYFNPERHDRYVRRGELLAILTQFHKAARQNTWYSKLWRWLKNPRGSKLYAVERPQAEVAREQERAEAAKQSEFRQRAYTHD